MESIQTHLLDVRVWAPSLVCLITATLLYRYYVYYYNYWPSRGIKGRRPFLVVADLLELVTRDRVRSYVANTKRYGKIWGTFAAGHPRLVIADPEVIRQVCIKDFDVFQNHKLNEWSNKYQRNFLVWLKDDHWKRVRAVMTPSFTSGKIKRMYKLLDGCSDDLVDNFKEIYIGARQSGLDRATVDLFDTYSMYTMDGITTCCYGLKLKREKTQMDSKRASTRNALVNDCNKIFKFNLSRFIVMTLGPAAILKLFGYKFQREDTFAPLIERVKKLVEIRRQGGRTRYDDLLQMIVDSRADEKLELNEMDQAENHHASLTAESIIKDQEDLKSSFINGNCHTKTADSAESPMLLSDLEIVSEAVFLLAAGLDTTRSSLSTITYLLSHNPQVQERLYEELKAIAKYEETVVGKRLTFDYDDLTSCQYLDAVISETLRFFGPVPATDRHTSRDYVIEKYGIKVPKGTQLLIAFHAVQNDPDYWKNPEEFNPDRFMPGEREKIVPGSYSPFGIGPRHCIGMRFSLTETKLGLAKVVMNFKFEPAPGAVYPPQATLGLGLIKVKNCKALVSLRD